jgi:hypothetical protein
MTEKALSTNSQFKAAYEDLVRSLPFLGHLSCLTSEVIAGSWQEITTEYLVGAAGVADGATLKITFRFYSDWAFLQTNKPDGPDFLSAELFPRQLLPDETASQVPELKIRFDQKGHERPYQKAIILDVIDGYLRPGDRILIRLGDRRFGGPGTRVQTFVEEQFRFRAYVDPVGTSRFAEIPDDLILKIIPGRPAKLNVITPRLVKTGMEFPIVVCAVDEWGNVCPAEDHVFQVTKQTPVTEELGPIKPETNEWATASMQLVLLQPGETILKVSLPGVGLDSGPIPVTADDNLAMPRAWFADLHVHSNATVGTNSTEYNLRYGRDVAGLDIMGYTANDFNIGVERWKKDVELSQSHSHPDRFLCYPGVEWNGNSSAGGDRNVVFLGDTYPFPSNASGLPTRSFEWNQEMQSDVLTPGAWPVNHLHAALRDSADQILMIPHVGGRRANLDWFEPDLERLIEVASAWGHFDWFYQEAIRRGYRVGASAAGDEHRGRPGGGPPGVDVFGVSGGLTGVLAPSLNRSDVSRALRSRHTWATTGQRLVALLSANGGIQGDILAARFPVTLRYRLLGQEGWDSVAAFSNEGLLWRRNLHQELGFSGHRFRLRWGGARIKDRYRWAKWEGVLHCENGEMRSGYRGGLEHAEEKILQISPTKVEFQTDTYGDADSVWLELEDLGAATFSVQAQVLGFVKQGPIQGTSYQHHCNVDLSFSGRELLAVGTLEWKLPGTELFVAAELLHAGPMPREISDEFTVDPHGPIRAVYITGREIGDSKVWTSPIFFE